jgi:modulator of FtsH protease HflK
VLRFGKVVDQTEPGLCYRLPWPIQTHALVDIAQVRRAEVGFRTVGDATPRGTFQRRETTRGSTRTVPQEALMLTGDENIVEIQLQTSPTHPLRQCGNKSTLFRTGSLS